MPVSFSAWQLLGLIVISGMWWMYYVMSKDRHRPEPLRRLLLAFGLGMVACAISLATYRALEALRFPDLDFKASLRTAVYCFGVIGPVEEGAKILMAYLFVFRWREYDEPIDGFVYAASLSLGFACLENFRTVADAGWQRQLASTVALPITHALFGSIWGLGIAHAHFRVSGRARRLWWQWGSIAAAMLAHGLYDFLILAFQSTTAPSSLALLLWLFVIWRAHRLGNGAGAEDWKTSHERPAPEA